MSIEINRIVEEDQISEIAGAVRMSPHLHIPETGVPAWQMVPGEMKRILQYQEKGDVATFDELRNYLGWLWQQPILL